MAIGVDDALEGAAGVLVGLGIGLVGAMVMVPGTGKVLRPLAKRSISGYLMLQERLKETAAEAREQWSDLVAEIDAERQHASHTNGQHQEEHEGQVGGA